MNLINIGNLDKYCPPKRKVTDDKGVDAELDSQTFLLIRILNWIFGSIAAVSGVYLINEWHNRDDYANELKTTLFIKLFSVLFIILTFVCMVCSAMVLSNVTHDKFSCNEDTTDVTGQLIPGIQHQSIKTYCITIVIMCVFLFIMSLFMTYDVFFKKTDKQKKADADKALKDLAGIKSEQYGTKAVEEKLMSIRSALEQGATLNTDDKPTYESNMLSVDQKLHENQEKIETNKQKILEDSEKVKASISDSKTRLEADKNFRIYKDMFRDESVDSMTSTKKRDLFKYLCENNKNKYFKELVESDSFYKTRKDSIAVYCTYGTDGYKELENFESFANRGAVQKYFDELCKDDWDSFDTKDMKLKSILMIPHFKDLIIKTNSEYGKALLDSTTGKPQEKPFSRLRQFVCKPETQVQTQQTSTIGQRPVIQAATVIKKEHDDAPDTMAVPMTTAPVTMAVPMTVPMTVPMAVPMAVVKQELDDMPILEPASKVNSPVNVVKKEDNFVDHTGDILPASSSVTKYDSSILKTLDELTNYNGELDMSDMKNLNDRIKIARNAPVEKQQQPLWFSSKKASRHRK